MSENKTTKVHSKGVLKQLKKKKKSRTNREGSTSNSESAEPAGTSLEPSTLDFEGAGAFEENNPVHPVQQEEMDSDDEEEPVAAESAVNLCSPAPVSVSAMDAEGSSSPVAQVQASSSLDVGQYVHSGGSSSLSSSSSFTMNVSQAPTSQDKSFKLEG